MPMKDVDFNEWYKTKISEVKRIIFSPPTDARNTLEEKLVSEIYSEIKSEKNEQNRYYAILLLKEIDETLIQSVDPNRIKSIINSELFSVGWDAYSNGNKKLTADAWILKLEYDSDSVDLKNNLSYMIRRGEIPNHTIKNALIFLKEGAVNRNPFSLLNLSLVFLLNFKEEYSFADKLVSYIKDYVGVYGWWSDLYKTEKDPEGALVLCLLNRHGFCRDTEEIINECVSVCKSEYSYLPTWIYSTPVAIDVGN